MEDIMSMFQYQSFTDPQFLMLLISSSSLAVLSSALVVATIRAISLKLGIPSIVQEFDTGVDVRNIVGR